MGAEALHYTGVVVWVMVGPEHGSSGTFAAWPAASQVREFTLEWIDADECDVVVDEENEGMGSTVPLLCSDNPPAGSRLEHAGNSPARMRGRYPSGFT
ncbi:MAG: hypothetical protein KAT00_09165 [Planctomycetes bacterium]|nr:hypothetical protein [Planctomycetota bacterium]